MIMDRIIDDVDFVIFDVETTGLSPKDGDRIVEIGALRYKNGQALDSFSSLLNPQRPVSPGAFAVNRISQEMLKDAPTAAEVLPKFLEFAGNGCLAGYNVGFDMGFLEAELGLFGQALPEDTAVVDIIQMARRTFPGLSSYGLGNFSRWLGCPEPQDHRALSDVRMTVQVFSRLLSELKKKGIGDFSAFYNLFGVNPKLSEDITNQHIAAIQKAIDLGVRLKIKYYSSSAAKVSEREVSPKEIRREGKSQYLVGYCHLRKDERTFKINAILNLEIL